MSRVEFNLPTKDEVGYENSDDGALGCPLCVNSCRISNDKRGFCGITENRNGTLHRVAGTPGRGFVEYYHDALPTNCVAAWTCSECERGHYTNSRRSSFGIGGQEYNLAVFYQSCTFDCLFCQNWHFRRDLENPRKWSARQLADAVNNQTRCVCYFGGDPASQMPHSLAASHEIMKRHSGKVHMCWETNGSSNPNLMRAAARLALKSGGTIKFDLKAFTSVLHYALTGSSNYNTLNNFRLLANMARERPDPPLLCAATLLVPGYIDLEEIRNIARFIADCDTSIPYSLLAFSPAYLFPDMPVTSAEHAHRAKEICIEEGLTRVIIGNRHLLSREDYIS
jgi:pyruvate formate lyase activating enzyme